MKRKGMTVEETLAFFNFSAEDRRDLMPLL